MAEHPLDAVALTIKPLVVADRLGAVRFRRDDGLDTALLQIGSGRGGVGSPVSEKSGRLLLGQIDQRVVALAIRRLSGREGGGAGATLGLPATVKFTGGPAPR